MRSSKVIDAKATFSPFRVYNDEIAILGSMAELFRAGAGRKLQIRPQASSSVALL